LRPISKAREGELYRASNLGPVGRGMTFSRFDTNRRQANHSGYVAALSYSQWLLGGQMGLVGEDRVSQVELVWNGKRGIMLYGPKTGCGKTHLACAIANWFIGAGLLTVFLPTVRIPRNDQEAILNLADPSATPVLILDDLGAEKATERLLECLYTIVDGRLWAGAPTIVTTNLRPDNIRRYGTGGGHGDKLYSRLMQMCECVPVDGPDRRL